MMIKVGDKVQIDETVSNYYGRRGIVTHDDACETYPYTVKFDDGDDCIFKGSDLIVLSTEGETSVKFKVGDKVKVSDSWFGNDGQVGVVVITDNYEPYNYNVKFDVEGNNERYDENFRGDSLELVTQSFTKSDLKTGMGVVLRNGSRAHVLLGTDDGDVIRFLAEGGKWGSLSELDEQLYDKDGNQFDIVEVYSTTYSNLYMTDKVFDEKLVFKREEPKPEPTKMTMKEINEHFGKAIEIIE